MNRHVAGRPAPTAAEPAAPLRGWSVPAVGAIATLLIASVALLLLYRFRPAWRNPLFGEDGMVEWATAAFFLVSAIVGLAGWLKTRPSRAYRRVLPAFGVVGLLGFLDEVSFGARQQLWAPPTMPGGGEFDGIHDLVIVVYGWLLAHGWLKAAVTMGVLLVIAAAVAGARTPALRAAVRRAWGDTGLLPLGMAIGLVGTAMVFDLGVGPLARLGPLEELCELSGAFFLMLSLGTMVARRSRHADNEPHPPALRHPASAR